MTHLAGRPIAEMLEAARRQAREHEDCRDVILDLLDHIEAQERTLRLVTGTAEDALRG